MMSTHTAAFTAGLAMLFPVMPLTAQQRSELPARDQVLRGTPTTLFSVGREEGEDYELFASVTAVGFDGADQLYVLDGGNQRIVVFDARGRYVRTIGRRGDGPGEFSAAVGMSVGADGSVLVADIARAALSYFSADGEYRSIALPTTIGRPAPGGLQRDARDGVVLRTQNFSREALAAGALTSPLVRLAPLGERTNATTLFEFPLPAPTVRDAGQGRTIVMMVTEAFAPQPLWATFRNGGAAIAFGTGYRIQLLDPAGRVLRTIERPLQPRRVTREDREREVQRRVENAGSGTPVRVTATPGGTSFGVGAAGGARSAEEIMRNTSFADVMPVLAGMLIDPTDRLWVQRTAARVGDHGPIDLIAADGRYLGTLPPQQLPGSISASGRAAYRTADELGVPRVVVRRLPPEWR